VAELAATRKPATVSLYLIVVRQLLDFVRVPANPARDPRVKLPKHVRDEPQPPTGEHLLAILAAMPARHRLFFLAIEQSGLRVGEALGLRWGDVDAAGSRLRLPRSATKHDRARWVNLPGWLMDAIEATCPIEDRVPDRKVFQGVTADSAYRVMARACRDAGVPHYSPHDLRHRRATIWHASGVPARELAERLGHARPSTSLDVYSDVLVSDDDLAPDRFRALIGA
jgi:integrase